MSAPLPVPVHPLGPTICTCLMPHQVLGEHPDRTDPRCTERGVLICLAPMTGEDGLCSSCRDSSRCAAWRAYLSTTPKETHV